MTAPALAGVGIGASILGTGLGMAGAQTSTDAALRQNRAQVSAYQYQAGVADLNRKIAEQNRDYAVAAGEQEAMGYGLKARQQMGKIKVAQGASGLDVNSGSAVDVRESQKLVAGMDMATIRNNAARVAYGHAMEAASATAQKGLYEKAAADTSAAEGSIKKSGKIAMLSSLISGASSVSSKWLQAKQYGAL